jgi:hypothetical protein
MNTKQAMQRAKHYIKNKQYDKARRILAKVDHPTARKWESKLDEVAPRRGWVQSVLNVVVWGIVGFVVLFLAYLGWAVFIADPVGYEIGVEGDLSRLCRDVYRDDIEGTTYENDIFAACRIAVDGEATGRYEAELRYCYGETQKGELEAQFEQCLIDNEYVMPRPAFNSARATATARAGT